MVAPLVAAAAKVVIVQGGRKAAMWAAQNPDKVRDGAAWVGRRTGREHAQLDMQLGERGRWQRIKAGARDGVNRTANVVERVADRATQAVELRDRVRSAVPGRGAAAPRPGSPGMTPAARPGRGGSQIAA